MRSIRPAVQSLTAFAALALAACSSSTSPTTPDTGATGGTTPAAAVIPTVTGPNVGSDTPAGRAVFLVIDEESIDNGNLPNNFSETDVNDQIARRDQRAPLRFFALNANREIDLFTGSVGDEGWHALTRIPTSWISAGPTSNGARNYLQAGPGLGGRDNDDLLDKVPDVRPLRGTGLAMLTGRTVCAIVKDGDVSTNYSPLMASLKGEALGIVAFDVVRAVRRTDGSTSDLPRVTIRIRDAAAVCGGQLVLFANAPAPRSSSEPFDVGVPSTIPAPSFTEAR